MQPVKLFERTYLHIGLGKTGSSAIQEQLYRNADLLEREYDIHYPRGLDDSGVFDGNHSRFLSAMFVDGEELSRPQIVAGFKSRKEVEQYAAHTRARFEKGFAASSATRLLVSAEAVGHHSEQRLILLSQWLRQFSKEILIVACVRHPLEALSSEIQERLKRGFVLEDLYQTPPYYKLRNLFGRVDTAFSGCDVCIYDFARAAANPAGLAVALLEQIGVQAALPVQPSRFTNTSMSQEAALLLSALNRSTPMVIGEGLNKARTPNDVIEFIGIPGRKYQAPAEVHERLRQLAEPELSWLKATHGIELQAAPVQYDVDHNYFSQESINSIALRIARLNRYRYFLAAPFRFSGRYVRALWKQLITKIR